jgi:hypothetical protein
MASDAKKSTFIHCPVTLIPSEVCHSYSRSTVHGGFQSAIFILQLSRSAYERVKDLAPIFNLLVDRIRYVRVLRLLEPQARNSNLSSVNAAATASSWPKRSAGALCVTNSC